MIIDLIVFFIKSVIKFLIDTLVFVDSLILIGSSSVANVIIFFVFYLPEHYDVVFEETLFFIKNIPLEFHQKLVSDQLVINLQENTVAMLTSSMVIYMLVSFLVYHSTIKTIIDDSRINNKFNGSEFINFNKTHHIKELIEEIKIGLILLLCLYTCVISLIIKSNTSFFTLNHFLFFSFVLSAILFLTFNKNYEIDLYKNNSHFLFIIIATLLSITGIISSFFNNLLHFVILLELYSYTILIIFVLTSGHETNLHKTKENHVFYFEFKHAILQYTALNFLTTIILLTALYVVTYKLNSYHFITVLVDITSEIIDISTQQQIIVSILIMFFSLILKLGVTPMHMYTFKMYKGLSVFAIFTYT
jgi:hypothetical protein